MVPLELSEGTSTSSLVLLISGSFPLWEDLFDKGSEHDKTKVLPFLSCLWAVHWSPLPCWMANDTKDVGSIPGSRRSPGVGNGNPLLYSCLENSMDRGAWQTIDPKVTKSQTKLSTHTQKKTLRHEKIPNMRNEISRSIVQSKTVYILCPGSKVCLSLTLSHYPCVPR